MALAGHKPQDTTMKNCEQARPDYLRAAVQEIDALFTELSKHMRVRLRYGMMQMVRSFFSRSTLRGQILA